MRERAAALDIARSLFVWWSRAYPLRTHPLAQRCALPGCTAAALASSYRCFVHASDAKRETALKQWLLGTQLDLRKIDASSSVIAEILEALPLTEGKRHLASIDFSGATFRDGLELRNLVFRGNCVFFQCEFSAPVNFDEVTFEELVAFGGAAFRADANFMRLKVEKNLSFFDTAFDGDALFQEVDIGGEAIFTSATFAGASWRKFEAAHRIDFVDATFTEPIDLTLRSPELTFKRARFAEGGRLELCGSGDVVLDRTWLGRPLVVTRGDGEDEDDAPRIASLRSADVDNLVVAGVDMRACRFANAHHLEKLRLEGEVLFEASHHPSLLRGRGVLAEEHQWRESRPRIAPFVDWYPEETRPRPWLLDIDNRLARPLEPRYISNIYRDLRRGREQAGDEPGAADFFYGEMEMRRFDRERPWAERLALTFYWLVAGYGLRATRALIALAITIVVFAVLLHQFGFEPRTHFTRALLFSAESTSNLFRTPTLSKPIKLTEWGETMQIPLRLLGPLFFGLALLSLRGRVKR